MTVLQLGPAGPTEVTPTGLAAGSRAGELAKRVVDIAGSVIGLLLLLPLLVVIGLAVIADGSGSPLYRQTRVGRGGRPFRIVKFRSMQCDADTRTDVLEADHDADGPLFKLAADPRVTRVGRVLRRYSLDELPQLWNVLRGDMSLVGPRPALQTEVDGYCPRALRRLEVLPGMTGPWQVGGRCTLSWQAGLDLDLHYVDHRNLRYDTLLLVQTVRAVVRPVGAY
ncbi:sugar transferase [Frondihabitans cladoniiphilus]|uniref:Bacterial sugar transferase domain-containing protein n=1 Tax=Frondihabitans cladoniiphilus TaxID=715785 RepID=A0ABP8W2I4_9MICO